MTWQAHQVVFRLCSPLHIGCSKVGNLQRTRPYVTGRVLWGALTMRLTRDAKNGRGPAVDSQEYLRVGEDVHSSLAYTYFYPATKLGTIYQVAWPWPNEAAMRHRFLSSYSATALTYPQQSAATGMLHEVEFITPHTLDTGEPVFLIGYLFAREDCKVSWQAACKRLQFGGERGYGWGSLDFVGADQCADEVLFEGQLVFNGEGDRPTVFSKASDSRPGRLLAHANISSNRRTSGHLEPLVGREWRSNNSRNRHAGQHIEYGGMVFSPGSEFYQDQTFSISKFGVWEGEPIL